MKDHACERDGRERSEHRRDSNIWIRDDDTCNPYSNQNWSIKHAYSYEFTHMYVIKYVDITDPYILVGHNLV